MAPWPDEYQTVDLPNPKILSIAAKPGLISTEFALKALHKLKPVPRQVHYAFTALTQARLMRTVL